MTAPAPCVGLDAQDRGEVAGQTRRDIVAPNIPTSAQIGVRRDEIHEARMFRDAERESPGVIQRAIEGMIERGGECCGLCRAGFPCGTLALPPWRLDAPPVRAGAYCIRYCPL